MWLITRLSATASFTECNMLWPVRPQGHRQPNDGRIPRSLQPVRPRSGLIIVFRGPVERSKARSGLIGARENPCGRALFLRRNGETSVRRFGHSSDSLETVDQTTRSNRQTVEGIREPVKILVNLPLDQTEALTDFRPARPQEGRRVDECLVSYPPEPRSSK
jgi:hypothetical protein